MSLQPFAWTYYSGLIRTVGGMELGLSICTFDGNPDRPFTHVGLTRIGSGTFESVSFWGRPEDQQIKVGGLAIDIHGVIFGPKVTHGDRVTAVGMSRHTSYPNGEWLGMIAAKGYAPFSFSGPVWRDVEKGALEPGAPWAWVSLRFDNGAREMYYEIGGKAFQWYDADGKGHPNEEVAPQLCWDAKAKHWWYGKAHSEICLIPVAQDSTIRDPDISGFAYTEAFCWIEEDGKRAGHAFVEVVPEGWGMAPRKSEDEMRLTWAHGDQEAARFLSMIQRSSQIADDFVDGDTREPGAMIELSSLLLFGVPENEFYARNRGVLGPILSVVFTTWECSEHWATDRRKDRRVLGYAWREAMLQVIAAVGLLTGGQRGGRDALLSAVDFYHGPGGAEGYEPWEAERASKVR